MQVSSALNPTRLLFSLIVLSAISLALSTATHGQATSTPTDNLGQLQARFQKEYQAIEYLFDHGPAKKVFPPDPRQRRIQWQQELAESFARAGATVDEILKLDPSDEAGWRELRETMSLYSRPTSPAKTRDVFGSGEVQKKAKLIDAPPADYPAAASAAKTDGEVRLRLVLAAGGTVKNIFPIKGLPHGLTEAAMNAARQIKFTPAVREGKPVSQFETLSYEFRKGKGLKPYHPNPEFYF